MKVRPIFEPTTSDAKWGKTGFYWHNRIACSYAPSQLFVNFSVRMMATSWLVFGLLLNICLAQFEGDTCRVDVSGENGKCRIIKDCPHAISLIKSNLGRPQICGFEKELPVVCCPGNSQAQKSIEHCNRYHKKDPNEPKFVYLGEISLPKEFPHMAIVGYGNQDDIQWLCGGSLISENFVLTAAHCVTSQDFGAARWIRLGDLDIRNTSDDAQPQDFTIAQTFVHPQFRPPSHYHDIALLRLNTNAQFTLYVKPACLQWDKYEKKRKLIATGWGRTDFLGESSSHLMKVYLRTRTYEQCNSFYVNVSPRRLSNGINDEIQICAGDAEGRDTCPGDSGGPLQYQAFQPQAFRIVGITSFGKACGIENSAGVYTRVSYYVSWIENIVWPE